MSNLNRFEPTMREVMSLHDAMDQLFIYTSIQHEWRLHHAGCRSVPGP